MCPAAPARLARTAIVGLAMPLTSRIRPRRSWLAKSASSPSPRSTRTPRSPVVGDGRTVLTRSAASEALSAALKQRGFKFVGPVIVYAWIQACGLVDDHEARCFRRHAS